MLSVSCKADAKNGYLQQFSLDFVLPKTTMAMFSNCTKIIYTKQFRAYIENSIAMKLMSQFKGSEEI